MAERAQRAIYDIGVRERASVGSERSERYVCVSVKCLERARLSAAQRRQGGSPKEFAVVPRPVAALYAERSPSELI